MMVHNDPVDEHRRSESLDVSMFILDVLQHDIEPLESIIKLLNDDGCIGWCQFWPGSFTTEDVVPALDGLVKKGFLDVYEMNNDNSELVPVEITEINIIDKSHIYWYLLTDTGRKAWDEWEPPQENVDK